MLDTDQLRSFLAIVDSRLVHQGGGAGAQDPVRRFDAHSPAGGAIGLRPVRQARAGRAAHCRGRAADRIRAPDHPGRGRGAGGPVAEGLEGRRQARDSGRLRRVVPGRDSVAVQSAPSSGGSLGRLRSRRSSSRRRLRPARSNWRWSPREPSSRQNWLDSATSSCCARSRWSGPPPNGSEQRRGRQFRWRWAVGPASGGVRPRTRLRRRRGRPADCSFPRISPLSDRSFAPGSQQRSFRSQWSAKACGFLGKTTACRNCP